MARAVVPLNFNAFLEKAKLKDDGSNYTDWVRNLRIILIAAQKNYVLEAPLGARPAAGATPDVVNVWQSKADDYSTVQCTMLYGLEPGLQRCFECLCCCRSMARATVPLNFNVFLEKAKLKDDGSNYTDWVRNLRIILIAA